MTTSKRVALITGCGKEIGIGASTARMLAASGVTVVVSDIEETGVANLHNAASDVGQAWGGLQSLVEEIAASGGVASKTQGDITSEADAARMVQEILDRYGRLDILVNNAGAPQGSDRAEIEDVTLAAWQKIMAINVNGTFLMSRAAVVPMRKQRWGRIINLSSAAAFRSRPRRGAYAASKAAIVGFTKSLSVDLAPFNITVNAVAPGPTRTSRAFSSARRDVGTDIEAGMAERAKSIPMGRHGTPEEVAATIVFLASEAASYVTGQSIGVNGGSAGSV